MSMFRFHSKYCEYDYEAIELYSKCLADAITGSYMPENEKGLIILRLAAALHDSVTMLGYVNYWSMRYFKCEEYNAEFVAIITDPYKDNDNAWLDVVLIEVTDDTIEEMLRDVMRYVMDGD